MKMFHPNLMATILTLLMAGGAQAASSITLIQNMIDPRAQKTWADITDFTITKTPKKVDVTITAGGVIPIDGSLGAIGYGIITGFTDDGQPENVLALTSHLCVADSFEQKAAEERCDNTVGLLAALFEGIINEEHNDATWHAHFLDLKPITESSDCANVSENIGLKVDLERTLATKNNVSPDNDVRVNNNRTEPTISVSNLNLSDFHNTDFKKGVFVSFGIRGFASGETVTHLCLTTPPLPPSK